MHRNLLDQDHAGGDEYPGSAVVRRQRIPDVVPNGEVGAGTLVLDIFRHRRQPHHDPAAHDLQLGD